MKVINYKAFFILFLAVALNNSFAQIKSITGTVIDSALNEALCGVNIFINTKADGKTVTSTTSDLEGQFTFKNINEKNISIKLSYIGYKDKYIDTIKISNDINLGKVMLSNSPITGCVFWIISKASNKNWKLTFKNISEKEIIVTLLINKYNNEFIDTIKLQVPDNNISVVDTFKLKVTDNNFISVLDALKKTGLINVDPVAKKIRIWGNNLSNVKVDGKPTSISSELLLSHMPASYVDNVEIIIKPSVKDEPENQVSIINIITRKNASVK